MDYQFFLETDKFTPLQWEALQEINCQLQVNASSLTDQQYAQLKWLIKYKQRLPLECPVTFNEKIQWLKLFYRSSKLPALTDKRLVRDHVERVLGRQYLTEIIGIKKSFREFKYRDLPEAFIVKCTHGSKWNIMVHNKLQSLESTINSQVDNWLAINYYSLFREWVYKDLTPHVLVEKLLTDDSGYGLLEYKLFCFDGNVRLIQIDIDRFGDHRRNFYDCSWRRVPCEIKYPSAQFDVSRPKAFSEMIAAAETLSKGLPFVRVDLFCVNSAVIFNELTFYPSNGFEPIIPLEFGRVLGDYLALPTELL